jgi:hypothetical protein
LKSVMIIISSSMQLAPRQAYTFDVIFKTFLGLDWCFEMTADENVQIRLRGEKGHIDIPKNDLLFDKDESMDILSSGHWNANEMTGNAQLIDQAMPVIFSGPKSAFVQTNGYIRLPIDILGVTFFMLSRIEESWDQPTDVHDRFPAKSAIADRLGFLHRPIVDEYIEILRSAMQWLWPVLKIKTLRNNSVEVTCDVDRPISVEQRLPDLLRNMGRDVIRAGTVKNAIMRGIRFTKARLRGMSEDQYLANIRTIMMLNEHFGNRVTFYFMTGSHHPLDGDCWIDHPAVRTVLREIDSRDHNIGLHPSYLTTHEPSLLDQEAQKLRQILEVEKIQKPLSACRQHYLRWKAAKTPLALQKAGFKTDATLGFPEKPGFRCGTAKHFPLYDLQSEQSLQLVESPLHFMDSSILGASYQNMGLSGAAFNLLDETKERAMHFGGSFNLLWHNCSFEGDGSFDFYKRAIYINNGQSK